MGCGSLVRQRRTRFELPAALGFLAEPHRIKCAYGGRGSAKSWTFARALLVKAHKDRLRILCARELQLSIQDSVHALLRDQVAALGLDYFYRVQQASIHGANGSEFIFSGLRSNPAKIKSTEGLDIAWVEEAEKVSDLSWELLLPTLRRPGSEIWITFNPHQDTDPTYRRFVLNRPPDCVSVHVSWRDNPWFPDVLESERSYMYATDPEAAAHVWGGETRKLGSANVLRGRYTVEGFSPQPGWCGPYQGADWGFANDPSTLVRCWVDEIERVLYIEHEAYGVGVDIDATPALFGRVPDAQKYTTRADSARPETISYMQRHGWGLMVAAQKGPGSVEDGVEHLRSYRRIVIHPRCTHAADEARLWSYKIDKLTGDVLPELVDKNNHIWDAVRYALEPMIKQSGNGLLDFAAGHLAARAAATEGT